MANPGRWRAAGVRGSRSGPVLVAAAMALGLLTTLPSCSDDGSGEAGQGTSGPSDESASGMDGSQGEAPGLAPRPMEGMLGGSDPVGTLLDGPGIAAPGDAAPPPLDAGSPPAVGGGDAGADQIPAEVPGGMTGQQGDPGPDAADPPAGCGAACSGTWQIDLVPWVRARVDGLPGRGSEGFVVPAEAQRELFRQAVEQLLAGQYGAAAQLAGQVGYQLVQLQDSGDGGALSLALLPASWSETQGGGDQGRGMFFLRPRVEVDRPMALSAPHPRFDSDSGTVAAMAFRQLRARSLAIAGTHRCANSALSGCSGSTSSCDSESSPYRESDMAHMERAFFQVFHERMDREYDRAIQHIQVHGMGSSADEPEFSISGGVTRDHDDPGFPSNRLASTLGEIVRAAGSSKPANSCNAPGQENMLCGTTNTQGRYTNGVDVAEVCMRSSGGNGVGRFIHAELSRAIRNPAGSLGPQTFVDALALVFPASAPPESSAP